LLLFAFNETRSQKKARWHRALVRRKTHRNGDWGWRGGEERKKYSTFPIYLLVSKHVSTAIRRESLTVTNLLRGSKQRGGGKNEGQKRGRGKWG